MKSAITAILCDGIMFRLTLTYFYNAAQTFKDLGQINNELPLNHYALTLHSAENRVDELLTQQLIPLRVSQKSGQELSEAIKRLNRQADHTKPGGLYEVLAVKVALAEFETNLKAELHVADVYAVIKKRGFDTLDLIDRGWVLFPADLPTKAPAAIADVTQACRCMAFELPTAAGFHLHRANESVMRRYYDVVTGGKPPPVSRNIGDYLNQMKQLGVGDQKVISALKDLKDLHRNPLIHPDDSLESIDEAIALMGSIQAVWVHMLKHLPDVTPMSAPATPAATPTP